jgi:hypothetical protein
MMFELFGNLPIYRSLPPSYKDLWMYFVDFEKNKPEDDGGKSRRTQFVIKLLTERESRVDWLITRWLFTRSIEFKIENTFIHPRNHNDAHLHNKSVIIGTCTRIHSQRRKD